MYCTECGKEVLDESKFCNACGTKLKQKDQGENAILPLKHTQRNIKNCVLIVPLLIYGLYSLIITMLSLGNVSPETQEFSLLIGLKAKVAGYMANQQYHPISFEPNHIAWLAYLIIGLIFTYIIYKAMANKS